MIKIIPLLEIANYNQRILIHFKHLCSKPIYLLGKDKLKCNVL